MSLPKVQLPFATYPGVTRNARLQPHFLAALFDGRGQRKAAWRALRLKRCSDSNRLHRLQSEDE